MANETLRQAVGEVLAKIRICKECYAGLLQYKGKKGDYIISECDNCGTEIYKLYTERWE